jgi:hypothetical protein
MWWTYWFHMNTMFLWISTKFSIGRQFWPNHGDWLQICWLCWSYSNLGLKEANFRDFKDFDDVNACAYTHVQRYVCTSIFWIAHFCRQLYWHTFASSCTCHSTVYRYSTLADQTTFWQLHPKSPPSAISCHFFAPGLYLTVVDIKFAVKQISQF